MQQLSLLSPLLLSFSLLLGCTGDLTPNTYNCPTLVAPERPLLQLAPKDPIILTFSHEMDPASFPLGAYLFPQEELGECTPACPGSCLAQRCFVTTLTPALLKDAEDGRLSAARAADAIPLTFQLEGHQVTLSPKYGTLAPERMYDLLLTPGLLDRKGLPLVDSGARAQPIHLTIATEAARNRAVRLTFISPRAGAKEVPVNRTWLLLEGDTHLGDLQTLDLFLMDAQGEPLPLRLERRDLCSPVAKECLLLWPQRSLKPDTTYTLRSGSAQLLPGGRELPPWYNVPWFRTGEITWEWPLELSEYTLVFSCGCTHLRFWSSSQALATLEFRGGQAPRPVLLSKGLVEVATKGASPFRLKATGVDGSLLLSPWFTPLSSTPFSPSLVITEVYANPIGREPAQEYVEIANATSTPIDLDGFRITDSLEKEGDLLPPLLLAPRERALLVGAAYVAAMPDPLPPDPERVVWFDNALVTGGMTNKGEPLYLFDPQGVLVSRYGGWHSFKNREGQGLHRSSTGSCDTAGSWYFAAPTPLE